MHANKKPRRGGGGASGNIPATSGKRPEDNPTSANSQAGQAVTLTLPVPPSTNALFVAIGKRRVKSKAYKAWIQEAGWSLLAQRPRRITGPWEIDIVLPAKMRGDCDNYQKAILDLLVRHRVTADDRHCRRVSIAKTGAESTVTITVRAAP